METTVFWLSLLITVNFVLGRDELFLTPFIESSKLDEAKNLSRVDNLVSSVERESYAGYLTVNKTCNSNLFFWFFKAVRNCQTCKSV